MMESLQAYLFSEGVIPHGYCLAWSPQLVWSMVISDVIIGLSYYSIPLALLYFVRRHRELRFTWLLVMFSIFIFACGTTHFIDIVNIWKPMYQIDALMKILTATVSVMTAAALWPLIPKISAFILDRQRAHRELAASNQELEQFAYVVSHDLKSPLRSIGSFAGLLEKRCKASLDHDSIEYLEFIKQSVGQMNLLIDDLLRLAQVNASQVEMRQVSAEEALHAACELLRYDITSSCAQIENSGLPQVHGDARLLISLFQNLISNAIKFQRRGVQPRIQIGAVRSADNWQFSVRDNGIGIAVESREKLFMIFKRLHASEQYPGTGIGLVMCKKIVSLHGGNIWIESTPGAGTTLFFTLPTRPPIQLAGKTPAAP